MLERQMLRRAGFNLLRKRVLLAPQPCCQCLMRGSPANLRMEISMGTWDTGPFDNDTAADFANALDDAEPEAREALIRGVLVRTIDATGYLAEADEAVAAAALIAAQCPGGDPV